MSPLISGLLLLSLLACHKQRTLLPGSAETPKRAAGKPAPAPAMNDESAVGNGGGVLVALLHDTISHSLMESLEKPENRGILSSSELTILKSYIAQHEVLIQPVDPIEAATRHTTDSRGIQSKTRDARLLHNNLPTNQRVVFDHRLGRWVIQFDESAWNNIVTLSGDGQSIPQEYYPELLGVVLLYHHALKVIDRSGEGPQSLSVETPPEAEKRRRKSRHGILPIAGAEFKGEVSCLSASIFYEVVSPETRASSGKCKVTATFKPDGKVAIFLQETEVVDESFASSQLYDYTQENITITVREGVLTRNVELWGYGNDDVLNLSPTDHLYRVSPDAPSLTDEVLSDTLFCDIAKTGGLFTPHKWDLRSLQTLTSKEKCEVRLQLNKDLTFRISIKPSGKDAEEHKGTYEQIGYNLILSYPGRSEKGYLWICRDCRDHVVLPSGEGLWGKKGGPASDADYRFGGTYNHSKDPIKCGQILPPYTSDPGLCELIIRGGPLNKEDLKEGGPDGTIQIGIRRLTPKEEKEIRWLIGDYWEAGATVHIELINRKQGFSLKNSGIGLANPEFHLLAEGVSDDEDV